MTTQAEHVKCVMEALEHGFTHDEIVDECLSCTAALETEDLMGYGPSEFRHENMGWQVPNTFSENL